MSSSKDFDNWDLKRELVVHPDGFDGPDTAFLPGAGNIGVELHGGPTFYHETADIYLMMLEVLDWKSTPTGDLKSELALSRGAGAAGDWKRPFRKTEFLPLNPMANKFDSGVLWMSGTPQTVGNTTLFHYGTYNGVECRCGIHMCFWESRLFCDLDCFDGCGPVRCPQTDELFVPRAAHHKASAAEFYQLHFYQRRSCRWQFEGRNT